jgi:hypothetical protein
MSPRNYQTVTLSRGAHGSPEEGVCVMELASMLAGEPFSDHPRCVSPAIAGFLRVYNDFASDDERQGLYGYAAKAVGTKASLEVEASRTDLCLERAGDRPSPLPTWAKVLLGGAKGAGQRAAHAILRDRRHRRREALAFVDRLIALGETAGRGQDPETSRSGFAVGPGSHADRPARETAGVTASPAGH